MASLSTGWIYGAGLTPLSETLTREARVSAARVGTPGCSDSPAETQVGTPGCSDSHRSAHPAVATPTGRVTRL